MNPITKKRIIKDFLKLDHQLQEEVRRLHPSGFPTNLVSFYDQYGQRKVAIPYETDDTYYLLKIELPKSDRDEHVEIEQDDQDDTEVDYSDSMDETEYSDLETPDYE